MTCARSRSTSRSTRRLRSPLGRELDRVDVLVHGAGAYEMGAIERAPIADLDLQYRVNVRGPLLLTQTLLPRLRDARGADRVPEFDAGSRSAASRHRRVRRHAACAAGRSRTRVRTEVNADGVRVLTVYLGRTATARQARIFALEGRPYLGEPAGSARRRRRYGAGGPAPAAHGRSDGDPHAASGEVVLSGAAPEARRSGMKVVLFCGGLGTRLREYSGDDAEADGRPSAASPSSGIS